jgi:DnaK suppressor protein
MQCNAARGDMHSKLVRQVLESKLSEIMNPAGWRDSIAVRTSVDPTDTTQQIGDREMAGRSLSRNASLVRDVPAALNRLTGGSYGVCIDCEEPIASKRLAALPWTVRCQNDLEGAGVEEGKLAA